MNKVLMVIGALIVLVATAGVVALGRDRIGWTTAAAQSPAVIPTQGSAQPTPALAAIVQPTTELQPAPLPDVDKKGTVKPPHCNGITVNEDGLYSICGVAVANITLKQDNVVVSLYPEKNPPKGAGDVVVEAISLECRVDGKKVDGPHDAYANITLCFAVQPGQDVVVKFYDKDAKTWVELPTTIFDGQACAVASYSGMYVLVEK